MIDTKRNKNVKIAFMGSEEYRESLQKAALERRIKVQALIEDALEAFLSKESAGKKIANSMKHTPQDQQIHDWLDIILQHPRYRMGIEMNIKWAVSTIYAEEGKAALPVATRRRAR